jgi:hypothetical protein
MRKARRTSVADLETRVDAFGLAMDRFYDELEVALKMF